MFDYIDEKLKTYAIVHNCIGLIASVIILIVGIINTISITYIATAIIVGMVTLLSSWMIYGFAILIENSNKMYDALKCEKQQNKERSIL